MAEEPQDNTPLEDCPPPEAVDGPSHAEDEDAELTREDLLEANRLLAIRLQEAEGYARRLENEQAADATPDPHRQPGVHKYDPNVRHKVKVMRGENFAPYCYLAAGEQFPGIVVQWEKEVCLYGPYLEVMDHSIEDRYRDVERPDRQGIDHVLYQYQRVQYQYFGPVSEEDAALINHGRIKSAETVGV